MTRAKAGPMTRANSRISSPCGWPHDPRESWPHEARDFAASWPLQVRDWHAGAVRVIPALAESDMRGRIKVAAVGRMGTPEIRISDNVLLRESGYC
jgi:hypothetical protein